MNCLTVAMMVGVMSLAQPIAVHAQSNNSNRAVSAAAPRISGFDVRQIPQLSAGAELNFTVWGTPGAQAVLQIDGTQRPLALVETSPGVYTGVYTISQRDSLQPDTRVSANLRRGNKVGSATLDEALQSGWQPGNDTSGNAPQIERFDVRHGDSRKAGNRIDFTLIGTPGGRASVRLIGAQERLRLAEQRPGEYSGSYTIRPTDQLQADDPVVARLKMGTQSTTVTLERALDAKRLGALQPPLRCGDCATIQAINRVEVEGDGNYVGGAVAGGVLGAVVGSQVGKGSGRTAAQVVGTLGGAMLGREVHRRSDKQTHYDVLLRMQDGSRQTLSYDAEPTFRVGDAVRLRDGQLSLQR